MTPLQLSLGRLEMLGVYHLQKKSEKFRLGCKWQGYFGLPDRKIFQNKRKVLRGSPKFPTGISKRKIVFRLLFSTSSRSCANSKTTVPDSL